MRRSTPEIQFILATLFLVPNLILLLVVEPGGARIHGADAAQYIGPAKGLIEYGRFVAVADPSVYLTFGTPLYSVWLTPFLMFLPENHAYLANSAAQSIILFLTGFAAFLGSRPFIGRRWALLAQTLVIFNPNMLISAHLVQTEILFTFFLTVAICLLLHMRKRCSLSTAIWVGVLLGLATMTRPVGQFFILALPFVFILYAVFPSPVTGGGDDEARVDNPGRRLKRLGMAGVVSGFAAVLIVSPWLIRNYTLYDAVFMTTNAGAYLHDQYVQVAEVSYGESGSEATLRARGLAEAYVGAHELPAIDTMDAIQKDKVFRSVYLEALSGLPPWDHARAFARSLIRHFLSPGASNIRNLLGLEGESLNVLLIERSWRGIMGSNLDFIKDLSGGYALIFAVTLAFVIVTRVLGLAGLILSFRRYRFVPEALVLLATVALLMLTYLYLGQSRFRVPMEPILAVWATIGARGFWLWWGGRRQSGAAAE